jgi:hypothetical protein
VSGSLSDQAESVPPLVTKASFTLLEQVSSTWNSWMGENDTGTKELSIETKTVQHHCGKEDRNHRKKISERRQHPEQDSRSVDSRNSEDLFSIREVLVRPDDQGSLCFQEDEMGSAVHDAIVAQYLEQPYVNGKRVFVKTGDKARGRSKTRGILPFKSLDNNSRANSRAAERERKRNKTLARSLSRERSKQASRSRSRSTSRKAAECEYYEEEREVVMYESSRDECSNVEGIRESSNILVHHY